MKKFICFIFIFLLTGCWNYTELNEIAITTGLAIDKLDDKYIITALISNAKSSEGSSKEGDSQITTVDGVGRTITEAFQNIELKIPKLLYLRHIGVMVIGDTLAKDGIKDILDYLVRDPNSPNRFNLILSKNTQAGNVLKIISTLESFPSQNITLMLKNTATIQGSAIEISYIDLIKSYLEEGKDIMLPSIEIVGNIEEGKSEENTKKSEPDTYIKLSTTALFENDKLKTYTTEEDSIGINIINGSIEQMSMYTKCDGNKYIASNINSIDTKKEITKDLNVKINVDASGYITEVPCKIDLTKEKNINDIQKQIEEEIKKMLENSIKLAADSSSDVFGFGNMYYKKYNDNWKKYKDEWNNKYFKKLKYDIKVNVNLKTKGSSNKTIEEVYNKNG